ncbi:transposase [Nonomuraea sp. NPDC048882]|uniref:transposase n=1 Tax=Nonomuraea sp. NPDC048882 TaxID=3154347 RepID=UPI0033ECBA2D
MDRWHTGFVDLSGDQGLLGQVEGRTIAAVTGWLNQRDATWREQVAFVAIDMCTIFKAAVRAALPQARLVVDHFHVVQLANQALTEIRRRITVQIRGRRGRKGNREWELRNRLTRSAARMHGSELDPMVSMTCRRSAASASRSWPRGTQRKTCWTCSPWPAPTLTGPSSLSGCFASTTAAPSPACPFRGRTAVTR